METAKYITVLDFEQGDVCQYPISVWPIQNGVVNVEDFETKLIELGHNITNCEWMVHKNKPIIH